MIRLPKGTYICFGDEREPAVITLTESAMVLFYDRAMIAELPKAVTATFGQGFTVALPAWSEEALQPIAEGYTGPHQVQIRAMCASIILGITFEDLHTGQAIKQPSAKSKGPGGNRVPKPVSPPRKPAPAGQAFTL